MAAETEIRAAQTLIAQASLDPQIWPEALAALALATGSSTGQLVGMDERGRITTHWLTGVPEVERRGIEEFGLSDPQVNPRRRIGMNAPPMQLVADQDHVDADMRRRHPIYAEVFDRLDLAHNCQVVLLRHDDILLRASVTRTRAEGPLTAADFRSFAALAPHLQAAARLQLVLDSARNEALLESLDAIAAPAFLLDDRGLLLAATGAAEALAAAGEVVRVRGREIQAAVDQDQPLLEHAILSALAQLRGELAAANDVLRLRSAAGGAGVAFEVQALPARRPGMIRGAAVIMVARARWDSGAACTQPPSDIRLDLAGVRRAFGLTMAEAEIAEAVANGLTSNEIAGRRGVSPETVHSQVKAVLAKTRCPRRARVSAVLRPFILN
jgi:DNA-binding CsgD family transcriptional regulator